VVAQLVPLAYQAAQDTLIAGNMTADGEECGAGVVLGQDIKNARGQRGVRAVVEGQRDRSLARGVAKEDIGIPPAQAVYDEAGAEDGGGRQGNVLQDGRRDPQSWCSQMRRLQEQR